MKKEVFMKKILITLGTILTLYGGVYTQDLIKCMVKKTSPNDIKTLKTWMFFGFAQDKDLSQYAKITQAQKEAINKKMANFVTRLLTKECPKELKQAVKYEGNRAISESFEYLGRIAGASIMNSTEAKKFLLGFTKYLDEEKLNKVLK